MWLLENIVCGRLVGKSGGPGEGGLVPICISRTILLDVSGFQGCSPRVFMFFVLYVCECSQ